MPDPTKVAAAIRAAIEKRDPQDAAGGIARAALEYVAQAWDGYDASVPLTAVRGDVEDAIKLMRRMVEDAERACAPAACRDGHPGCLGDDPRAEPLRICRCPNVRGIHDARVSCP